MAEMPQPHGSAIVVRKWMLRLAKYEEDLAADELAQVPYWKPAPATALAHREAANLLRRHSELLLAANRAAADVAAQSQA